nr:hypothetical protein [Tanacetum cinerariifolium]
GPNCQGCALLRQELEENLVTYSPDFQDISEPSNASTNVVNAPREPYDAHIGYNCPSKVLVISNPEPCDNQTIDEVPQVLPMFHLTFRSEAESPFTLDSTPTYVDESPNVFNPPPQPFVVTIKTLISCKIFKMFHNNILVVMIAGLQMMLTNREEKRIEEEQAAKAQTWKLPVCYDDDDNEERSDSLDDNLISGLPPFSAITLDEPVLSTEEPDNSLSMGDEHLDTISETESDQFIKSGVEILIPIPNPFNVASCGGCVR